MKKIIKLLRVLIKGRSAVGVRGQLLRMTQLNQGLISMSLGR